MFANSSSFTEYATSPITRDHSLHTDLRFPSSPNSLTMYEGDADFLPSSLGSVCSNTSFVDTGQPMDDGFDLKPQFECTDNTFLHQCLQIAADGSIGDDSIGGVRSDPAWSPTEAGLMKMEDIFQVDQKDAIQGPTLAELNFDDSDLSVYDDPVDKEAEQKRLVTGGSNLWQQAILSGMDNTFSVPQVVCGGQKPPIVPKFTTCTVTSPTAVAIDMRTHGQDNKSVPMASTSTSHSTLPQSLYSVTAKLSLFSDGPPPVKIMSCPDNFGMTNSPGGCLKVPQLPQLPQSVTFGMLSSLVPIPQVPPASLIAAGKFSAPSNSMLPMVLEQPEDNKSSLQRLLTDPLPAVTIKSEPVDIPMTAPTPMWNPAAAAAAAAATVAAKSPLSTCSSVSSSVGAVSASGSPLKSSKRARSPEMDVASSAPAVLSMEQKWEEIKQFIYDEEHSREEKRLADVQQRQLLTASMQLRQPQGTSENQQRQQRPAETQQRHPRAIEIQQSNHQQPAVEEQVALTPPKRIKTEPKPADPAFTIKDEVESDVEDVDSDGEDSDDGGESVAGRDNDDNSDAESDSQFSILDDGGSGQGPSALLLDVQHAVEGTQGQAALQGGLPPTTPYTLGDFEDPVFDPELNQTQYKHNGKARRGDGNDITPSPQKLYALGSELKKLNGIINDLTPVSELPSGARSKSRKEKNKLASRACRLKKKAQHEANKVKLYGLEREHHDLLTVLGEIRENVFKLVKTRKPPVDDDALSPKLERLMKVHLTHMIAGHTADYVNSVLSKVVAGDPKGGLPL